MATKRAYGWHPSKPDKRDLVSAPAPEGVSYPTSFSLRSEQPPIWDQGQLGSCTAHGTGRIVLHRLMKEGLAEPTDTPSRLFIYYGSRSLEGTISSDSGAEVRDALKTAVTLGAPPETDWPYSDANPGPFTHQPPHQAYVDGLKARALKYYSEPKSSIKYCIKNSFPVVFGITVYESFESDEVASTGIVPMPGTNESVVGGHCMVIVGWDDSRKLYEVANSWNTDWGDNGFCWLPYDYVNGNDASDLWTIRSES